jgi:hypothetical protein
MHRYRVLLSGAVKTKHRTTVHCDGMLRQVEGFKGDRSDVDDKHSGQTTSSSISISGTTEELSLMKLYLIHTSAMVQS